MIKAMRSPEAMVILHVKELGKQAQKKGAEKLSPDELLFGKLTLAARKVLRKWSLVN
jgi:hypothetical protein